MAALTALTQQLNRLMTMDDLAHDPSFSLPLEVEAEFWQH